MNNKNAGHALRGKHQFSDLLYFACISLMCEVVAAYAIAQDSWLWFGIYVACMVPFMFGEVGFLCRHCPYYRQLPGRTVHCKSHWGPTKFFKPNPGPLSTYERVILYFMFVVGFFFPFYWLIRHPLLLAIYLWSILIMAWTYAKYECPRCQYFYCPFNFVKKEIREDFHTENDSCARCTSSESSSYQT